MYSSASALHEFCLFGNSIFDILFIKFDVVD